VTRRSVAYWHDFAVLNDGRDCTCAIDPSTCEAMVFARRRHVDPEAERARAAAQQLQIGEEAGELLDDPYDPATAPWPEGY
jgi:hypothetical protein